MVTLSLQPAPLQPDSDGSSVSVVLATAEEQGPSRVGSNEGSALLSAAAAAVGAAKEGEEGAAERERADAATTAWLATATRSSASSLLAATALLLRLILVPRGVLLPNGAVFFPLVVGSTFAQTGLTSALFWVGARARWTTVEEDKGGPGGA